MKVESGLSQTVEQRRAAMPGLAAIIDRLRDQFGVDFVNQQLATAQAARREYAQVLAQQGAVAAKRWHLANAHRCTFYGEENGRVIGMPSPYGKDL
jgi:hypothetical protein